jgi:hypothetical protein
MADGCCDIGPDSTNIMAEPTKTLGQAWTIIVLKKVNSPTYFRVERKK